MEKVHIFIAESEFASEDDLDNYLNPKYNDNGERIDSEFLEETQLINYEPMCIESTFEDRTLPSHRLCEGFSYWEKWINQIPKDIEGRVAVCVYSPNQINNFTNLKLQYCGTYKYSK
ncbi:MAG: hypothetical protein GY705_07680 [Bacteroidetes bacterium]|nr:hypothetical protein [Bacteroidota bacterium]